MSDYRIDQIVSYPVKGLGPDYREYEDMVAGKGMPNDRRYAITHANSEFDHDNPMWVQRKNFLVVARSPKLASLSCTFIHEDNTLVVKDGDDELIRINLDAEADEFSLASAFSEICGNTQPPPYKLVTLGGDLSLTDSPTETVSLMNAASLADFQKRMGVTLDSRRFRGNIWFNGAQAWEENDWVGKEVSIGGTRLNIVEPIVRCAAIEASPESGRRDLQAVKALDEHYGHAYFGVLAQVIADGRISKGDVLERRA